MRAVHGELLDGEKKGNKITEEDFSSALAYINAYDRLLHLNKFIILTVSFQNVWNASQRLACTYVQ